MPEVPHIPLALEPAHLDYIVAVLRRCPWGEANPILVAITQQVQAQQAPQAIPHPNGGIQPAQPEAIQ